MHIISHIVPHEPERDSSSSSGSGSRNSSRSGSSGSDSSVGTRRSGRMSAATSDPAPTATSSAPPSRPQQWPAHMYWHMADKQWTPAMHVDWYTWTRDDRSDIDVELYKEQEKSRRVALCRNVVPVELPGWKKWGVLNEADSMVLPNAVHRLIRRTNLLRYRFHSQKY